jgi:hypothetical protein
LFEDLKEKFNGELPTKKVTGFGERSNKRKLGHLTDVLLSCGDILL